MSDSEPSAAQAAGPRVNPPSLAPSLLQILASFSLISLYGFGGVLAWSRRMMVEKRGWMTADEFNDAYAMCQFLPGPNIVNLSVVFGSRVRGVAGAALALTGLLGPPVAFASLLAVIYSRYGEVAAIGHALSGVIAAAAGLLIATVVKMTLPVVRVRRDVGLAVGVAAFVTVGPLGWPLPLCFAVLAPLSVAIAWLARR
jgi:chromate transporter